MMPTSQIWLADITMLWLWTLVEETCPGSGLITLIVAGGDAPPVLELSKPDLDAASAFVPPPVVMDRYGAGFPIGEAGRNAPDL